MKNLKNAILEALVRPSGWTREKSKKRVVTNSYRIGDKYDSHSGMYQQDDVYNDSDYEGYILDKENNKYRVFGYSKQGDSGAIVGGSTSYQVIITNEEGFKVTFSGWIGIMSRGSNTEIIGAIDAGYYLEDYLCKFSADSISDKEKYEELKANGDKDAQSYVGRKNEIKKDKAAKFAERYINLPSKLQLISDSGEIRINDIFSYKNLEIRNMITSTLQPLFKETIEGTFNMSFNELGSFYGDILFKTPTYDTVVYFDTLKKNLVYIKKGKIEKNPVKMELASTCGFDITKVSSEFMKIIKEYYKYFRKKLKDDKSSWIENKTNQLWRDYVYSYSSRKYSKTQAKKEATEEYRKIEFSYNINRDDFKDKIVTVDIPSLSEVSKRVNPNFQNTSEKPDTSLNDAQDITIVEEPKDLPKKEKKFKKEQVYAKMTAWHNGERKQNVKGLSDDKLKVNIEACKELGYDTELQILQDEAKSRGLKLESISSFINNMICFENICSLKEKISKNS